MTIHKSIVVVLIKASLFSIFKCKENLFFFNYGLCSENILLCQEKKYTKDLQFENFIKSLNILQSIDCKFQNDFQISNLKLQFQTSN